MCPRRTWPNSLYAMGLGSQSIGAVAHAATILLQVRGDVVQLADLTRSFKAHCANQRIYNRRRQQLGSRRLRVAFMWTHYNTSTR